MELSLPSGWTEQRKQAWEDLVGTLSGPRLPLPRSLLQSPRTVCPLHRLDPRRQPVEKGLPVQSLSHHRQDRLWSAKTRRPSLSAAAQQDPPPASDTLHSSWSQIHESPADISLHDEHSGRLAHQGGSLGKARLPDAVKKQIERPQAGRARRGKIRPGRDPPAGSPISHPPVFSKSPLPGGWGVLLNCLEELGKRVTTPQSFAPACHWRACPVPSWASDLNCQQQVPPTPATCRGQKCHRSAHLGWPRADLEFRC